MIQIGRRVKNPNFFSGDGDIIIGDDVVIGNNVTIDITERLIIGDRTIISDYSSITGRDIEIGKEFWMGKFAKIGGGGAKSKLSSLRMGCQCHLGDYGCINTSRPIVIGDEVGMGEGTKLFTHGSYLSYIDGFPVQFGKITIGNNVWLPNATILPNVTIGDNTVVAAMSLVNKDLPSGCLAGGIPAKILKIYNENEINNKNKRGERLEEVINNFCYEEYFKIIPQGTIEHIDDCKILVDGTLFDFECKRVDGRVTEWTEKFKDYCRRWGMRFRYYPDKEIGVYKAW